IDRDKGLSANEAYHAAVVGLAENEHLSQGFKQLRLRELLASALKDTDSTPENVIAAHEEQTDAIASGDIGGAVRAILSWGQTSRATVQEVLGGEADNGSELGVAHVVDPVPMLGAQEQGSLAGDVDALVSPHDAAARLALHSRVRRVPPHLLQPAPQPGAVRGLQLDGSAGTAAAGARS